jgi:hypothetical protein
MRQPDDAEATHFQQPCKRGRGARDAVLYVHPVIRHEYESAIEQPERQVGFAGP